jgi:hypothetical protein
MVLFSTERAALKPSKAIANLYDAMFLSGAVLGWGSAILLAPSLDKVSKFTLTTLGMSGAICYTLNSKASAKLRKVDKCAEEAQFKSLKYQLAEEESVGRLQAEIDGTTRKVNMILEKLPPWAWEWWSHRAGVEASMPPLQQLTNEPVNQPSIPLAVPMGLPEQSSLEDIGSQVEALDYSWLDDNFIQASKAVFGSRGSGKTTYLNYEAIRFLEAYPDGELRIGDLHFDPDEEKWLPGVPSDVLLHSFVANKKDKIINLIAYCHKELKDRIDKVDKKRHRIKLIIDEFVGFLGRCDDDELKMVNQFLETSQDEGRKFGVDVTLGLHSLKKERCKIDSSVLWQMDVLCLANSIADPATKFPSDWENKALAQQRHSVQSSLKKGQGFACVVCKNHAGEPARVEVLPHIDLSQFRLNLSGEEVEQPEPPRYTSPDQLIAVMTEWMQKLEEFPSPQQVAFKWESLCGSAPDDELLELILQKLGLG